MTRQNFSSKGASTMGNVAQTGTTSKRVLLIYRFWSFIFSLHLNTILANCCFVFLTIFCRYWKRTWWSRTRTWWTRWSTGSSRTPPCSPWPTRSTTTRTVSLNFKTCAYSNFFPPQRTPSSLKTWSLRSRNSSPLSGRRHGPSGLVFALPFGFKCLYGHWQQMRLSWK